MSEPETGPAPKAEFDKVVAQRQKLKERVRDTDEAIAEHQSSLAQIESERKSNRFRFEAQMREATDRNAALEAELERLTEALAADQRARARKDYVSGQPGAERLSGAVYDYAASRGLDPNNIEGLSLEEN
jgi:chromosome segregation ATPase